MASKSDSGVLVCPSAKEWTRWLAANHADSKGVWLRFFKKASKTASVNHPEALAAALCYGWIDGQLKKHDEESWLRKFTPRRPKSIWSKRNREIIEKLVIGGKMKPAGLREVAAAKEDGRWDCAYDSPSRMTVPADFMKKIAGNKKARSFFETLSKANIYAIAWRLQTAKKAETRDRRMKAIILMLAEGKVFHA